MPRGVLVFDIPIWSTESILPSPAVTSRQLSAQFSVSGCPVTPPSTSLSVILAILIVASGQIRKNCPARCDCAQLRSAFPVGGRGTSHCSPPDTDCNLPRLNRDITTHFSFLTTMVRQTPHVNPVDATPGQRFHDCLIPPGAMPGTGDAGGEYAMRADRRSHQGRKPGTVRSVRKLASAEVPEGDLRRFCVCHRYASDEASWGRTAPDVRGGRANGARPSQGQAG